MQSLSAQSEGTLVAHLEMCYGTWGSSLMSKAEKEPVYSGGKRRPGFLSDGPRKPGNHLLLCCTGFALHTGRDLTRRHSTTLGSEDSEFGGRTNIRGRITRPKKQSSWVCFP